MPRLTVALLGSFRVTLGGEPVVDFTTDKAQALLAYLGVEADRPHRRDILSNLLWPDSPSRRARQSLRQALSQLRQAIGDRDAIDGSMPEADGRVAMPEAAGEQAENGGPFLLVSRQTIQFNADSDHWLDVAVFTQLARDCRRHRHRRRGTCLPCLWRMERMAALYEGEFMEQFPALDSRAFEEWVLLKREWLHREALESLACLADHHERRGELDRARRYARRQVEMEPWREEAHRQLMRLLAAAGQRSAALAQYKACREALATELDVKPTQETVSLHEEIRASEQPDASPLTVRRTVAWAGLRPLPPAPTPFVGRDRDLTDLADLLANPDCRLVTLVGPGGVGKTRLALEAGGDQKGNFAHGVAFVPLASVGSRQLLISALADAVGFTFREVPDPEQQLINYLREKELLLVLDGMEQILEGADVLARILRRAPGVVMLVTSRERLSLRDEWVRAVRGLTYPEEREAENAAWSEPIAAAMERQGKGVERYSAIKLFCQQARRVDHTYSLTAREMPHVVRICQLVDGLPLGVELAAAWASVRSCREMAAEIESNIDVLSTALRDVPDRHRSMRATFEYSWQLLSKEEQDLLSRLSVFRGGFSREAALGVTGSSLPTLLGLVDKSLVNRLGSERYSVHGLLTQFAADKLQASPEPCRATELAHARYFAAFVDQQSEPLRLAAAREEYRKLALDIENARVAWRTALEHDAPHLVEQSVEGLYLFYDHQCRFQEGIALFSEAAARWGPSDEPHVLAKVLCRQGALQLHLCQYRQARAALEQGKALFRSLGATAGQAFCLVHLASLERREGNYEEAVQLATRSLSIARELSDSWGITHSLRQLGTARYRMGDVDDAQTLLEESLSAAQESHSRRLVIPSLNMLADIACHRGDYEAGLRLFERCLASTRELGDQFKIAVALNNLGTAHHVLGQVDRARAAYQESLDICREIGDRGGQAIALSNLGELAQAAGAYADAEDLYRQGLAIGRDIRDQWVVMACLNNMGEVAFDAQEIEKARECFAEALTIAQQTSTVPVILKVLVNLAAVFACEGNHAQAVGLLDLARRHPASEQVTREKAERRLGKMDHGSSVSPDRSLDLVVREVLEQLESR